MNYKAAWNNLIRIAAVLATAIMSITFAFLLIARQPVKNAILLCVMGGVIIMVLGIANIYILGFGKNTTSRQIQKQRPIRYFISYLVSPLIYLFTWIPFEQLVTDEPNQWINLRVILIFTLSSWVMNSLLIILYNYNYLHSSKLQSEMKNLKLEALVSETSNQVLKQQIHPHFLFNVLNTVKTLYKQDNKQGEEYLVHLANFLRASLSNPTARIVRMDDELRLCKDYIEMQRIRFGIALTYEVEVPDDIRLMKFIPYFAIQTLLENAIKHNDLTEEKPLNILVTHEEDSIIVSNNYQPRGFKEPSTGQGLNNLSERYRLLTGDGIDITQSLTQFTVIIKLLDNEDSHH